MRNDLPPGAQAAQAVHAALDFSQDHPHYTEQWWIFSNYLVIVSTPDEASLQALESKLTIPHTSIREPDFGDQLTAIALQPGLEAQKICAQLPLALKESAMVT